jgi:predicted permease
MSLRRFFRRDRQDHDRADEMESHIDLAVQHYISQGVPKPEAERLARVRFGNVRAHREGVDDLNRLPLADTLARDVRYALRVLRRSPAFTITAIATLAVVIGANTAVFSIADHVLLRALPYPDPSRLAIVMTNQQSAAGLYVGDAVDGRMWNAIRDQITAADRAVYMRDFGRGGVNFGVGQSVAFVKQERISAGFFRVLGVAPLLGREFSVDEDQPGGPRVAVLSYHFWRSAFGARDGVVGETMTLRGEPYTVIGVMPESFVGPDAVDLWTPLRPSTKGEGGGTNYCAVLRLKPGATMSELDGQLRAISNRDLFQSMVEPGNTDPMWLSSRPMQTVLDSGERDALTMLSVAVGLVLVIACVNIASLLLARGGSRQKELATRMALGSGRAAVIRQLMAESMVVAVCGGLAGLLIGALGLEALKGLTGDIFENWQRVTIDGPIAAWTIGVSALTSVVFGLVPAWQASRIDVQAGLRDGGSRSIAGGSGHWLRRSLVLAEVALGVVLLVCAGLLIRSFTKLNSLNPGFDPAHLTTSSVSLQDARYVKAETINGLFDRSLSALESTPGVEAAAVSLELPYTRLLNLGTRLAGDTKGRMANVIYVTPGYASTFRIPLRQGRDLAPSDRAGSAPVVLVNETYARLYSPGQDVIGRRVAISGTEREIVGVIGNVQQRQSFQAEGMVPGPITNAPAVFVPASQLPDAFFTLVHQWFRPVWTVRSSTDAASAIRAAVQAADPQLPVAAVQTMAQVRAAALGLQRLLMTLVGVIAGAALLLAAMGLHGLIASSVAERTREFGIRMALGASIGQTIRSVAVSGVGLALVGAVAGGALSVLAVRLERIYLWGVQPGDPLTYVAVMAFLVAVAAASSLIPAFRLARLDPAKTLRE